MIKVLLGILLLSSVIADSEPINPSNEDSSTTPPDLSLDNLLLAFPEDSFLLASSPTESPEGVSGENGDLSAPKKNEGNEANSKQPDLPVSDLPIVTNSEAKIITTTGADGLINDNKYPEGFLDYTILSNDDSCLVQCPSSELDRAGCFSDGNIYYNNCYANCKNKQAVLDFTCNMLQGEDCGLKCQQIFSNRKCKEQCGQIAEGYSVYCYRDMTLNVDTCRAKCDGSNSYPVFDCYRIGFKDNCWSKCRNYINTLVSDKCAQTPKNYVCGRDGLVYTSECHTALAQQIVIGPAEGASLEDQRKCAVAATIAIGVPLGKRGYVA